MIKTINTNSCSSGVWRNPTVRLTSPSVAPGGSAPRCVMSRAPSLRQSRCSFPFHLRAGASSSVRLYRRWPRHRPTSTLTEFFRVTRQDWGEDSAGSVLLSV